MPSTFLSPSFGHKTRRAPVGSQQALDSPPLIRHHDRRLDECGPLTLEVSIFEKDQIMRHALKTMAFVSLAVFSLTACKIGGGMWPSENPPGPREVKYAPLPSTGAAPVATAPAPAPAAPAAEAAAPAAPAAEAAPAPAAEAAPAAPAAAEKK